MGKRGPAPIPTNVRILRGDRPGRINRNEPQPRLGVPECPAWLDADAQRVWEYTVGELRAMRLATPADRDVLAAYCVMVVQFERATRLVTTAGLLIRGVKGPGQVVKNPAAQLQRDAAMLLVRLAGEFGLSPRARAEIGNVEPDVSEEELARLLS
jgi:P27 family predicted phage terminase small subunit